MKLTPKQELFITEYMIDLNAAAAATRAGYSTKVAKEIGYENLTKPHIKKEIDKRMEQRATDNGITADFVLKGIKAIAVQGEKESDQLKAYELLGRHLKLFTDKIEAKTETEMKAEIKGKELDLSHLSVEELKELLNNAD